MSSILVVDDDLGLLESFQKLLSGEGYSVSTATNGEEGLELLKKGVPDLVIMDVRMPGPSGLEIFKEIQKLDPKLPVIIVTAFSTTETAIEATKLGAFDYILKPFEIPDILALIKKALDARRVMCKRVKINAVSENSSSDVIIGNSPAMQEVYKAIGRVAPTDATVLIRGESGVGKELIARALYNHSLRSNRPFQVINCVAIPEPLLESELFGYEKGAFTGATHRRIGKIERACGGTIFLDEIGDMPVNVQGKLLRLLQEKNIERLGSGEVFPIDVRIIAATNRDLESAMKQGRFREDLYFRLSVVTISVPPLRKRSGDIRLLCDYFLNKLSKEMAIDNPGMTDNSLVMLETYSWPGNVRELANSICKALLFNRGCPIRPEDFSNVVHGKTKQLVANETNIDEILQQWAHQILVDSTIYEPFSFGIERVTQALITEALKLARGNRSHAAKLLGVSRPTLLTKIKILGLDSDEKNCLELK